LLRFSFSFFFFFFFGGFLCGFVATLLLTIACAAPEVEKWSHQYKNIKFLQVNVDQLQSLAARLGVRAMPTFKFLRNGTQVGEVVGADISRCLQELDKLAASADSGTAFAGSGYRLGGSAAPPPRSSAPSGAPTTIDVDADEGEDDAATLAAITGRTVPSLAIQRPPAAAASPFLDALVGMGFSKAHASRALQATGDRSIDAAVDWIMENPDPSPADAATETAAQPASSATPAAVDGDATAATADNGASVSDAEVAAALAAADGGESETTAAGVPKASLEERKQAMVEKLAKIRAQKAEQAEVDKKEAELKRLREAKESQASREQWKAQKDKLEAERAKKERAAEMAHKQKLKAQVELDKLNRKAEREAKQRANATDNAIASTATTATTTTAAQPTTTSTSTAPKVYTEAQVSVQLPSGLSIEKAFAVDTTVADVAYWVNQHVNGPQLLLVTPFPRVTYDSLAKQATTLAQIDGFVPRGKFLTRAP
jgi:hypothetical protein